MLLLGAVVALGGAAPPAEPRPSQLVIQIHGELRGQGIGRTFEASDPMCPFGKWADTSTSEAGSTVTIHRTLICADGSGQIVFRYRGVRENIPGTGTWRALSGTGKWMSFRGEGTSSNVVHPDPPRGSRWTNTWTGQADFDAVAPTARIEGLSARRASNDIYVVRTVFRARDNDATNAVSYSLRVLAGNRKLAQRSGRVTGRMTVRLSIRPGRARTVRTELRVSDPLNNSRTVRRSLLLRR